MLAANGLDPKKMKLYIQPIYLEKGNISELTMEDTVDILTPTKNRFSPSNISSFDKPSFLSKYMIIVCFDKAPE